MAFSQFGLLVELVLREQHNGTKMIDLDTLASQKASASGEEETIWKDRLHSYSQSGLLAKLTDGEFQRVLVALRSVAQLDRLQNSAAADISLVDQLFSACDKSPFDLADWLASYDQLILWLEEKLQTSRPLVMVDYLNRCVTYAESKPQLKTLNEALKEYLNVHGFDGKAPHLT